MAVEMAIGFIPSAELASLMTDVKDHEPMLALDGGADGLATVRELVSQAAAALRPGGWLLLETAAAGAEPVAALLASSGAFDDVETLPDLAGLPRIVGARRAAG